MHITSLREATILGRKIEIADSSRNLFILELSDICLTGRNIHYPNCLLSTSTHLINPYDEKVMSLNKDSFYDGNTYEASPILQETIEEAPCFFFIYNVDNYYHFIYDTLPILYSYFQLKKQFPTVKLLLQTSHPSKQILAPFVINFLQNVGIDTFEFAKEKTLYKQLFVSTSFTHGGQSNDPPSPLSYSIWNKTQYTVTRNLPKRIYISRRSWVHGKTENLGTNYTARRKCMNEDALVQLLEKYDIQEVFTELLTTEEKIAMFLQAELVVGIVGGGMCNLLFSPKNTKSLCISTPYFLDINQRFKYSMNHTNILYSNSTSLAKYEGIFPLYSRVRVKGNGKVGEVEEVKNGEYRLTLSSNDVAGFSQDFPMESCWFQENDLEAVDKGLNSPFEVHLEKLEEDLKTLLSRY